MQSMACLQKLNMRLEQTQGQPIRRLLQLLQLILSTVICLVEVETADYMKYLDIGCLTCTERAGRLS